MRDFLETMDTQIKRIQEARARPAKDRLQELEAGLDEARAIADLMTMVRDWIDSGDFHDVALAAVKKRLRRIAR